MGEAQSLLTSAHQGQYSNYTFNMNNSMQTFYGGNSRVSSLPNHVFASGGIARPMNSCREKFVCSTSDRRGICLVDLQSEKTAIPRFTTSGNGQRISYYTGGARASHGFSFGSQGIPNKKHYNFALIFINTSQNSIHNSNNTISLNQITWSNNISRILNDKFEKLYSLFSLLKLEPLICVKLFPMY